MLKKIIFILVLISFILSVNASVELTKSYSATEIRSGDEIIVYLSIENKEDKIISGVLIEGYPPFASPKECRVFKPSGVGGTLNLNVSVDALSKREYNYTLTFESIPQPVREKEYDVAQAELILADDSRYYSNTPKIYVKEAITLQCNFDSICEPGENNHNCPQDCPSGLEDGLCDGLEDLKCDPDCQIGQDPDCTTECGNGLCDEGEDYLVCRIDCPPQTKDGFCVYTADAICDPDCAPGEDPDCIAETTTTSTTYITPDSNEIDDIIVYAASLIALVLVYFMVASLNKKKSMRGW